MYSNTSANIKLQNAKGSKGKMYNGKEQNAPNHLKWFTNSENFPPIISVGPVAQLVRANDS